MLQAFEPKVPYQDNYQSENHTFVSLPTLLSTLLHFFKEHRKKTSTPDASYSHVIGPYLQEPRRSKMLSMADVKTRDCHENNITVNEDHISARRLGTSIFHILAKISYITANSNKL